MEDPGLCNAPIGDFTVLSAMTNDLAGLGQRLQVADPEHAGLWRFLLLTQSLVRPFEDAIPILEEHLKSEEHTQILAPLLLRLGELPGERVTDLLVRTLSHVSPRVRLCACLALQARRTKRALTPLMAMLDHETDPAVVQMGVVAFLASGPACAPQILRANLEMAGILSVFVPQGTRTGAAKAHANHTGA